MKIAIFAYSRGGCAAARRVRAVLAEAETVCYAVPRLEEAGFLPLAKDIYRERFSSMDALIFIGACGIAVREIAPYLVSKKTDPAVLCIDEKMQFVIPLLSGHIGGANDLARRLAAALGAAAVITTATDVNGKFAADAWAAKNGCAISSMPLAKKARRAACERFSDQGCIARRNCGKNAGCAGNCDRILHERTVCRNAAPHAESIACRHRLPHGNCTENH